MSARKCNGCGAFFSVKMSACPDCGVTYSTPKPPQKTTSAHAPDMPRVAPPHPCMAHGCPMVGTWNPIIYGESPTWQCFIHSDLPGSHWQAATQSIIKTRPAIRHLKDEHEYRHEMRKAVDAALARREPGSDDE